MVALAPKTYFAHNSDDDTCKLGSKGIPKTENLEIENYLKNLYTSEAHSVIIRSLRTNQDGLMTRTTTKRVGLGSIFVKFRINDDGITCSPLTHNYNVI